jgi:hypothetical protein
MGRFLNVFKSTLFPFRGVMLSALLGISLTNPRRGSNFSSLGHCRFLVAASSWIFTAHSCRYTGRCGSLKTLFVHCRLYAYPGARDVPIHTVKHLVQDGIPNAVYMALSGYAALFAVRQAASRGRQLPSAALARAHDCSPSSSSERLHS